MHNCKINLSSNKGNNLESEKELQRDKSPEPCEAIPAKASEGTS